MREVFKEEMAFSRVLMTGSDDFIVRVNTVYRKVFFMKFLLDPNNPETGGGGALFILVLVKQAKT